MSRIGSLMQRKSFLIVPQGLCKILTMLFPYLYFVWALIMFYHIIFEGNPRRVLTSLRVKFASLKLKSNEDPVIGILVKNVKDHHGPYTWLSLNVMNEYERYIAKRPEDVVKNDVEIMFVATNEIASQAGIREIKYKVAAERTIRLSELAVQKNVRPPLSYFIFIIISLRNSRPRLKDGVL